MNEEEFDTAVRAAITNIFGASTLRNCPTGNINEYYVCGATVEDVVREWAELNVKTVLDTYYGDW